MLGNKMIESICIVWMNNSKINIIERLQRVLICNSKRFSMCNGTGKIAIRKKMRKCSRLGERWFNECRQRPVQGVRDRPMKMRGEIWSRRMSKYGLVHRRDGNR